MNDRTCIVTRQNADPDRLIRFVAAPDSTVVPDLKRNLPGRGCWVTADREHIEKAVASKKLFARALRKGVHVPKDLADQVDRLLARSALGALGLARKAGKVALGAAKVENAVRSGTAALVLHAFEAADDGVRKITQARRATVHLGGPHIAAYKLFAEPEMGLALGSTNVIHAAVLAGDAGTAAVKRVEALDRYRGGSPEVLAIGAAVAPNDGAAEDME
ncbi:MAG: RNA-binding protein [Rhizobiaceae bacterium]|nr:RNA-binding protein [Rhizobiaceae bacterium]